MNKVDNEVKIAEKLKFWEEQDQINKELIPRVVKNHEMITDLTFQFEKSLTSVASLQANIDKLHEDLNSLTQINTENEKSINNLQKELIKYEELKNVVNGQGQQIQEIKNEISEQGKRIQEIKSILIESNTKEEKRSSNRLISIGVICAIILSIIGILL